jgi:solute carrier family 25 oxoglutarate transporter 11
LRQATYTTARLGIFNKITEEAKRINGPGNLPLWQKAACGLTAGGLGALVGTPADLTLLRMQADATLPVEQRRNYKGVGDALVRIVREDGVAGLFRGGGPTVVRAMALNMGMLASNDQAKEAIQAAGFEKGSMIPVVGGALIAGFFASACSLPFDFVKTRMQKMTAGPDGKMPYSGPMDCALKTLTQEGPLKFYSGFPTYIVKSFFLFGLGGGGGVVVFAGAATLFFPFSLLLTTLLLSNSPPTHDHHRSASRRTPSSRCCSWTRCPSSRRAWGCEAEEALCGARPASPCFWGGRARARSLCLLNRNNEGLPISSRHVNRFFKKTQTMLGGRNGDGCSCRGERAPSVRRQDRRRHERERRGWLYHARTPPPRAPTITPTRRRRRLQLTNTRRRRRTKTLEINETTTDQ